MSVRQLADVVKQVRWTHCVASAGMVATFVGFPLAILGGMGGVYKWYYADEDAKLRAFIAKFGLPSEKQRLEVFEDAASRWDTSFDKVEQSGVAHHRREVFATARGDVLEVGVGTGRCFEALIAAGNVKSFVGLDLVESMLQELRKKLPDLPFPAKVVSGDAHALPFPDASFDTVTGSICVCSMERPVKVLEEMARVCRPGGEVLLMEPGLASNAVIRWAQGFLGLMPYPKHAWEVGWYDDRDPAALVRECAALRLVNVETRGLGNWYLIRASPVHGEE
mmetsp:Transcript_41758/g.108151  ORF Transcript_41758/g.108151 Transcript_41758/m.108151 type:complete len:279 (+) Transcript_41758:77-913(+)